MKSFCLFFKQYTTRKSYLDLLKRNKQQTIQDYSMLKTTKSILGHAFFFSTKPHNCPHPNSTLYTLSKERVGRLKHFSISCMLPQNRATARCAVLKHQHCIQKTIFYLFIYYKHTVRTVNDVIMFWVE